MKSYSTFLRLLSVCLLAGALFDFGLEFYLACQEQSGKDIDITQINVTRSVTRSADLFNQQLSECESEALSRVTLRQHGLLYQSHKLAVNAHPSNSRIATSKIRGPVFPAMIDRIIRQHRLII